MAEEMREGFWKSFHEPNLPEPVASDESWDGQSNFLKCLDLVEAEAKFVQFRGISPCRVCQKMNGSREFQHNGWAWPAGLRHYLEDHNVKPSKEFRAFIVIEALRIRGNTQ